MKKAVWSQRYGWHLREDMDNCKNCEHGCHCTNGGSCTSCECKDCNCKSYEANNA